MPGTDESDYAGIIRASAADFLGTDLRSIRTLRFVTPGIDRRRWSEMAEMGWISLFLDEDRGGLRIGTPATCGLAEEWGRALLPDPLLEAAIAAVALDDTQLSEQLSGSRIYLPAWQSRPDQIVPDEAPVAVSGSGVAPLATGIVDFVPMAAAADGFVLATPEWTALVAADARGLTKTFRQRLDGGHFGRLTLTQTPIVLLNRAPVFERAILPQAAYLLGATERAFELTLNYLRLRQQFGKPIGSFQSLQHLATDLKIQIDLTRASL